ncbi:T9SS type A sorting domain-containing protein [Polaribacter sp.]|uniref:T9SS type A sorting domain-containing protein n=1 Tax=Polaribacter sp. TaxID=1920175 RepID=UPI0025DAD5EA|nr:T9SS type A sorting domain-containing protein [Polaribacter sp.]
MKKITIITLLLTLPFLASAQVIQEWDFTNDAEGWSEHNTTASPSTTSVTHSAGQITASYAADTELPGIKWVVASNTGIPTNGTQDFIAITMKNENVNAKYLWFRAKRGSTGTVSTFGPVRIGSNDTDFRTHIFKLDGGDNWGDLNPQYDIRFYLTETTSNSSGDRTIALDTDGTSDLIVDKIQIFDNKLYKHEYIFKEQGLLGWEVDNAIKAILVETAGMRLEPTGGGSRVILGDYKINANTYKYIRVRYKNESATNNHIQFNVLDGVSSGDISINTSSADVEEVDIDMSSNTAWTGDIAALRLFVKKDGAAADTGVDNRLIIESIGFLNTLSTEDITKDDASISVFPNPTSNIFTINSSRAVEKVEVFSVLGQKVLEVNSKTINLSSVAKGAYILKVYQENNVVSTKRIIKQ